MISKEVGYENTCIWIRWKSYLNNDLISKYSPNIQVIDIIDVAQRIHIRKENEISMTDEQYLKKCKNFKQKFVKVFFDEKKQFQLERKRKIIWKNISNMNDIDKRTIKRKELFQIKRLIENKNYNEREKLLNNFK